MPMDWTDEDEFYGRMLYERSAKPRTWPDEDAGMKRLYINDAKAVRNAKYVDQLVELASEVCLARSNVVGGNEPTTADRRIAKRMYELGARVKV